ncbi:MAG: hypothetical protein WAK21_20230, partial [Candidatus Sulfotelmatobacter sp.]
MTAVSGFARAQNFPAETSSAAQTQANHQSPTLRVTQYTLPAQKLAKAEALYRTTTVLYLFGMIFGIVVLWVLLRLRVAPLFRDFAERVTKNRFV